jgi:hypothetical protein
MSWRDEQAAEMPFVRKYDMETGPRAILFWAGFAALP